MSGKRSMTSGLGLVAGLLLGGCVLHEGGPGYSSPGYPGPSSSGGGGVYGGTRNPGYGGLPPSGPSYPEPPRRKFFEPEKHVVCNSKRQVCYEDQGGALQPSVRETKQYFGKGAAKDLKKDLRRQNGD